MDLYQNRSIKFKQCENPPPPKNILICFDGRKVAGVAAGRVQGMRDLLIRFKAGRATRIPHICPFTFWRALNPITIVSTVKGRYRLVKFPY